MHDFRRLEVWEESMALAVEVYALTAKFPATERYGLTAQLRSSAVSVSSNIAEGSGRAGVGDMARFLRIALGSLAELTSQLELAVRVGLMNPRPELTETTRVLAARILKLHDRITGVVCDNRTPSTKYQVPTSQSR
jgi:four helix bundle protein